MTTDTAALPPTHASPVRREPLGRHRRDRVLAWVLLAAWAVLAIETVARGGRGSTYTGLEGWVALGWAAVVLTSLFLASGARPWRATRWAWAWLILLLPPYGVLAFLVLGGPLGILAPRDPRRAWLTGGWGFLLALLLGGASNAA